MPMLIRDGYVVTMNANRDVFAGGFVLTGDDGRILRVGGADEAPVDFAGEVVDARGMLVMPGLVNARQQPWQHLVMGVPAKALSSVADCVGADDMRVAASLAAREMLDGGTTCVLHHMPPAADAAMHAAAIEAIAASGMRQVAAIEWRPSAAAEMTAAVSRWQGGHDGRTDLAVQVATDAASVAEGLVSESDIARAYRFAVAHGLRLTTRAWADDAGISWDQARRVTGRSSVTHLMELGLLDDRWLVAEAQTLGSTDVMLMRESGCHAVATPIADAMQGRGSTIWTELRRAGVPLALGSDGPALSCTVDMVEQMKALVLVQNTVALDPTAMSAEAVMEMATLGGARALGLQDEIGSLEEGKRADIAVFDMRGPHFQVSHKPVSTFVCCARGADVHMVLVDGHVVRRAASAADTASKVAADRSTLSEGITRSAALLAQVRRGELSPALL